MVIFLGKLWPATVLHDLSLDDKAYGLGDLRYWPDHARPITPVGGPDTYCLAYLCLYPRRYEARAMYVKWLFDALQADPTNRGLRFESDLVHEHLVTDLRSRTQGAISREVDRSGVEHWRWMAPYRSDRSPHPAINYLGHSGVPVYRALWPLEKPGAPIPCRKEPIRDLRVCSDNDEYPCVRPEHFRIWYRTRPPAINVRRKNGELSRLRSTGLHPDTVTWHARDDGVRVCKYGDVLGAHYQDMPENLIRPTVYCAVCHQVREEERKRPRRPEPSQEVQDLAAGLMDLVGRKQEQRQERDPIEDMDLPI